MAMRAANRGPQGINLLPRVNWSLDASGGNKKSPAACERPAIFIQ